MQQRSTGLHCTDFKPCRRGAAAVHWLFTSQAACLAADLRTCYQTPACVQAFAEEVTNLQKQDAGPEQLQQKLVQVGWSGLLGIAEGTQLPNSFCSSPRWVLKPSFIQRPPS